MMSDQDVRNIERAVGRIEGQTDAIRESVAEIKSALVAKTTHDAELLSKVDKLDGRVREVEDMIASAGPTLAELERWRERGRGAVWMGSFLAASMGATMAALFAPIKAFILRMLHG